MDSPAFGLGQPNSVTPSLRVHFDAQVPLAESMLNEPYLCAEAPSVNGRHILLWGTNPFVFAPGGPDCAAELET
eukprot:342140-Amphidinium_carterae.1